MYCKKQKLISLGMIVAVLGLVILGLSGCSGPSASEQGSPYNFVWCYDSEIDNYHYISLVSKDKVIGDYRKDTPFFIYGSFLGTDNNIYFTDGKKIEKIETGDSGGVLLQPIIQNNNNFYYTTNDYKELYLYDLSKKEKKKIASDVMSVVGSPDGQIIVFANYGDKVMFKKGDREENLPEYSQPIAVRNDGTVYYTIDNGDVTEFRVWKNGKTDLIYEFDRYYDLQMVSGKGFNDALIQNGSELYLFANEKVVKAAETLKSDSSNLSFTHDRFLDEDFHLGDINYTLLERDTIRDMVLTSESNLFYIDKDYNLKMLSEEHRSSWRYGDFSYCLENENKLTQLELKTGKKEEIPLNHSIYNLVASLDGKVFYYTQKNELFMKEAGKEAQNIGQLSANRTIATNIKGDLLYVNNDKELCYVNRGGETIKIKDVNEPIRVFHYLNGNDGYFYVGLKDKVLFGKDGRNFKNMDDSNVIEVK